MVSVASLRCPGRREKSAAARQAKTSENQVGSSSKGMVACACGSMPRTAPSQKANATPTPEISLSAAETNTIRLSTTKTPMYPSTAPARTPAIIGSRQRSRPAQKSAKPLTGALRCR